MEIKGLSVCRITGYGTRFQSKKTIIQSDPSSPRYEHKCDGLVCAKPNCHVLANTSGQDDPFELLSFAFKPCALAGSPAYRQPCDFEHLFSPFKGAGPNFSVPWAGQFCIFTGVAKK